MNLGSNVTNHWHCTANAVECERLARHIAEAFQDVPFVEFNDIDGIPCVEFAFPTLLTPDRVLELGHRLCAAVGEYPVQFHQVRGSDVTFLVMHELLREGYPFTEEQTREYGTPFAELVAAWSARSPL